MIPFSELAQAAFCPRQLYYARREDDDLPEESRDRIDLAFQYPELVDAPDRELYGLPIDRSPAAYRRNLSRLRERDLWTTLTDPDRERAFLAGRETHGVVHKVLEPDDGSPPLASIVSPGTPPEQGVWEPQRVRAVAAAKALSWEQEREIPRTVVEYPAVGVVRTVEQTTRNKATYRKTIRTVRSIDGPPPRVDDDRCGSCTYRDRCGVRTRSMRSLLGRE